VTRRRAVFLDRDGVLNEAFVCADTPTPPRTLAEFRLLPGVEAACRSFADAGLVLVVVTNQPDVSRGTLAPAELARMHDLLRELLPVDDICACTHDDSDGCPCRKPRPGMILDAARRLEIDLNNSVCVGDRWRDIDAAGRAGVRSVHIKWDHREALRHPADASFSSLLAARDFILAATGAAAQPGSSNRDTHSHTGYSDRGGAVT